jgi:hypothetical protein
MARQSAKDPAASNDVAIKRTGCSRVVARRNPMLDNQVF